ncbi:restriction endonuclease subunit S [Aeromonas jandaei]|uniref:restriction endonuclease subunit S n=1 Tax=Aeromonas jandaei TaxID=650 RepID=UPI0019201F3C|nr:restriction endonuclease subunit S [Aeromonas jandaei]MBL0612203.1 restriction endonuclease subunit S [Aeromonas jandaei]
MIAAENNPISKYQPYSEYKDSGVEWLGDVPSHWIVTAVKRFAKFTTGWTPPTGNDAYFGGNHLWANISDVGPRVLSTTAKTITDAGVRATRIKKSPKGSLLFSFKLSIGLVSIVGEDMYTNEAIATFFPSDTFNISYMYWAAPLFIPQNAEENIYGAKLLNQERIGNASFVLPTPTEQKTIAAFLNYETARIDRLIAQQQRLIELLKEKRQAVISHAVTKGLNPNAPMKDSGIEWLGQVPEHWATLKFNHCASIRNGQVDPTISPYNDHILIAPNHIESGTGRILYMQTAEEQGADSGKYICKKGEVIYSKIRPALVKVCLSPENHVICSADMYPICGRNGLENDFLLWFLLSDNFTRFAVNQADRVAMPKINRDSLSESRIPVPPKKEQVEIVSFLNRKTGMLDTLIEKSVKAITLMQERRTALISAAVTGKIDLRGWTPPAEEVAA